MSRSLRAGLVLLGLISVLDLLTPLVTDGDHPPMPIALGAAVLGLVSLALVVSAWRGAKRAIVPLVAGRVMSALAAVPAVFVAGTPGMLVAAVAAGLAITVTGAALVLAPRIGALR
ncbi:hypothetical protein [Labedaea rhizosphaerae]|uniref:Integral membrane protein n=1 Tax=Labedaea rhizosphaerae TaxID=598644 RepID=A0A4R6S6B9_LABRH|nr:hypothetical protein [Labedaea rhizosphaerae]TDP94854.1 hypothetical protein EV186_10586 [Labedaea rhizosphaerae]